jgi:3-hydroxyacyl-CoA dehydrogenase/enoyl-CoA hydratase/3-hydroxybutyryl-CoA epimerase
MTKTPNASAGIANLFYSPNNVAVVQLGGQDEKVVTLTKVRMDSLRRILADIREKKPVGVVFTGPTTDMFTAGADINVIRDVTELSVGEALALEGQKLFDEIEALPMRTVAAISGACVGGGCEMVLACKVRVISDAKSSQVGLPEVKLGILPGFGGTQRLPRLIGLPRALDVILAGKTLRSAQALSYGLVDEVAPVDKLLDVAITYALGTKRPPSSRMSFTDTLLTFTGIGRKIVSKKAGAKVKKETKGFYPAPPAALAACLYGLENGLTDGYAHEAKELGRLIITPESKALTRLFFLTEGSKGLGKPARKSVETLRTMVVGAGTMGAGIAGSFAKVGYPVILKDVTDAGVQRGLSHIKNGLASMKYLSDAERDAIYSKVEGTSKDSQNEPAVQLAVEAVFEEMEVKKKTLGGLATKVAADAILATNTSSLSVTEIASHIQNPDRVVGMHFFNPVEKMPLVEIVRGAKTSDKTVLLIAAVAAKLGKFPVIVNDVPGFLVNRTLVPYLNEAAYLLEEGYSVEDIDKAAQFMGMPMGPIRLLDEIGLDVAMHVGNTMVRGYGTRMAAPNFAGRLASQGRKGKKSGAGFYNFTEEGTKADPQIKKLLGVSREKKKGAKEELGLRLILPLINESVRCLDEGVAGAPGVESAQQIDLASVMGYGFPAFRGGILYFAQSLGAKVLLEKLSLLERTVGSRFAPAPGIEKRAKSGASFLI